MVQEQMQVKSNFKAPEGNYTLYSDRHSTCSFNAQRPVRLTFATLQYKGEPQHFVIYNQLDALAFAHYSQIEKVMHTIPIPSTTAFQEAPPSSNKSSTSLTVDARLGARPVGH